MTRTARRGIIVATLIIGAAVPLTVTASPAMAAAATASDAAAAVAGYGDCTYTVVWRSAGVWERPTRTTPLLKHKHAGDRVRGYSHLTYYNRAEHVLYRAVDTASARDGIGWMKAHALELVHC